MRSDVTVRRLCVGALAVAAAIVPAAAGSLNAPAHAARAGSTPTVAALPSTALTDGQYASVTFSGFLPGSAFDFRQCSAAPVNVATDCTALLQINHNPITVIADNTGAGSTYVPVYSGTDPLLARSGAAGTLTCDDSHTCTLAAMPNATDLTTATLVPISFAPSPDLCPPPGSNEIVGSGSAAAYRAIYQWQASVCRPPSNISMSYTLKNSPDGALNFLTGLTQFGVTGPWAPSSAPMSSSTPPQTWDYAPLTMSGLVVAYRMYDLRGPQITTLTLTPDEIARVFTGALYDFGTDAGVLALNPGIQFPSQLTAFVRAEHSAESWVFSSWLAKTAAASWKYGGQEIFPAPFGVQAATGSAAVGFDVLSNPNQTFAGQGTIGFMDSSTAAYYGLPTVRIANPDGTTVAATPTSIEKAVAGATLNSDNTVSPGTADDTTWPMLIPTYMMVPTNNVTPAVGLLVATLLRYAVQGGQSNLPQGYAPLTPQMTAAGLNAAAAVPITSPPPPPTLTVPKPSSTVPLEALPALAVPSPPASTASPKAAASPRATSHRVAALAVTSAPLLVTEDGSRYLLPGVLLGALVLLLAGALLEGFGRVRDRRLAHDDDA